MLGGMHFSSVDHLKQKQADRAANRGPSFHSAHCRLINPQATRHLGLADAKPQADILDADFHVHGVIDA